MPKAIIDGNNLVIKSSYSGKNIITKTGVHSGGIYLFLKSLLSYRDFGDLIVVFDGGHSQYRKDIYPDYKLKKSDINDIDFDNTKEMAFLALPSILPKLGIPVIKIDNHEADDIIYILSKYLKATNKVTVVSDDEDYVQMINIDIDLYRPMKDITINKSNFLNYYDFSPEFFVLYKCMVGDRSDNIIGIRGIGPVKATKIIKELKYPTIEDLYRWSMSGDTTMHFAIRNGFRNIKRNKLLIDFENSFINEEIIINHYNESLKNSIKNIDYIIAKFKAFELNTLGQWISHLMV